MTRELNEWPAIKEENQIFRLEVRPDHGEKHFLILEERTYDLYKAYKIVGKETTISLSHHFDTIYGVSSIAGMDANTAIRIGQELIKWGEAHREPVPSMATLCKGKHPWKDED